MYILGILYCLYLDTWYLQAFVTEGGGYEMVLWNKNGQKAILRLILVEPSVDISDRVCGRSGG